MSRIRGLLKPTLHIACAVPLGWTALRAFAVADLDLGANPIDELIDVFGTCGLRLLLLTLFVTPLAVTLRKPWIYGARRLLGLWGFTYLLLHFSTWLVLDQTFDVRSILVDLAKRPYITVGFAALSLLVPLAVTSTAGWMRRLGRRWHRLHRLIYPAATLGVLHFWWQVRADWREPLVYAVTLGILLGWRAWRAHQQSSRMAVRPVVNRATENA